MLTSARAGLKNYSSSFLKTTGVYAPETSINAYQTILRYRPADGDYYRQRYPCYDPLDAGRTPISDIQL